MTRTLFRTTLVGLAFLAAIIGGCDETTPSPAAKLQTAPPSVAKPSAPQAQGSDTSKLDPTSKPTTTRTPSQDPSSTQPLIVAGLTFDVSTDWQSVQPKSRMRLAKYLLPGAAGPAELVFYCFGRGQGGSMQANLGRWVTQFQNPDDSEKPAPHKQTRFGNEELNGLIVTCQGTYAPTPMAPHAPAATPKPNYALHAVIVENGPGGTVFAKTTGPRATVEAHTQTLNRMARSVRLAD